MADVVLRRHGGGGGGGGGDAKLRPRSLGLGVRTCRAGDEVTNSPQTVAILAVSWQKRGRNAESPNEGITGRTHSKICMPSGH
eukprot:1157340-Pelagomonas_calceolata.AAC.10